MSVSLNGIRKTLRSAVLLVVGSWIVIGIVSYTRATGSSEESRAALQNYGAAPELRSLTWLNSDAPLRLTNLRGSVVLLEFWTFDCINCIHTLPYVESWYQRYKDNGLVVAGIHFPEFSYERDLQNVVAAADRLNVEYPIGLDNDGATWNAYGQRYWPTIYLIDKQGIIRAVRIGEGGYDQTENMIRTLLAEPYEADPDVSTPELPRYGIPTETVNVRSGPSLDAERIGSISPGVAFIILGERDGWLEFRYNDGSGFVSGEYVEQFDGSA